MGFWMIQLFGVLQKGVLILSEQILILENFMKQIIKVPR